jgi:hypothetical protein
VPIPLPLLHTLRSAGGDGKRHFESREVFLEAAENSCGFGFRLSEGATSADAQRVPENLFHVSFHETTQAVSTETPRTEG